MKIPWHLALCLTCTEQCPFVTMGHLPTEPSREKESKRSKLSVWSHQGTPTSQSAKHEENVRESMGITSVGCKVEAKNRVSGLWSSMDKTEGKINQEMTSCWLTTCCWQVIEESELLIRHQFLDKFTSEPFWACGLGVWEGLDYFRRSIEPCGKRDVADCFLMDRLQWWMCILFQVHSLWNQCPACLNGMDGNVFFMKSTPGGWCEAKALTNRVFV